MLVWMEYANCEYVYTRDTEQASIVCSMIFEMCKSVVAHSYFFLLWNYDCTMPLWDYRCSIPWQEFILYGKRFMRLNFWFCLHVLRFRILLLEPHTVRFGVGAIFIFFYRRRRLTHKTSRFNVLACHFVHASCVCVCELLARFCVGPILIILRINNARSGNKIKNTASAEWNSHARPTRIHSIYGEDESAAAAVHLCL